jgi:hypothetical protein
MVREIKNIEHKNSILDTAARHAAILSYTVTIKLIVAYSMKPATSQHNTRKI